MPSQSVSRPVGTAEVISVVFTSGGCGVREAVTLIAVREERRRKEEKRRRSGEEGRSAASTGGINSECSGAETSRAELEMSEDEGGEVRVRQF